MYLVIKEQLLNIMISQGYIEETDLEKLEITKELTQFKSDIISLVINDFISEGYLKPVLNDKKETIWINTPKFETYNHNVSISIGASNAIAETLRDFANAGGNVDSPSTMSLTEADIVGLVEIIHLLLQSQNNETEDDE